MVGEKLGGRFFDLCGDGGGFRRGIGEEGVCDGRGWIENGGWEGYRAICSRGA